MKRRGATGSHAEKGVPVGSAAPPPSLTPREQDAVVLIFSEQGVVEYSTSAAQVWLASLPRGALSPLPVASDHGQVWRIPVQQGVDLHCVWIQGPGGRRILARLMAARVKDPALQALSPRQREVARRAAEGATLLEVADDLGMSVETARTHLKEVYRKTGVTNRAELVRYMSDHDD